MSSKTLLAEKRDRIIAAREREAVQKQLEHEKEKEEFFTRFFIWLNQEIKDSPDEYPLVIKIPINFGFVLEGYDLIFLNKKCSDELGFPCRFENSSFMFSLEIDLLV